MASAYRDFMRVYEDFGHMERVPDSDLDKSGSWYSPHHAVIQPNQSQRKIRVVFDASCRTMHQESLNKHLLPRPPLQKDLSLILTDWRRHRIAFTADIVKMFRQIQVDPLDRDLHCILWRSVPGGPPVDYRLNTVTYGTSCASFIAIRTLQQLATDEGERYPLGAQCLLNCTFVDDMFIGCNDITTA